MPNKNINFFFKTVWILFLIIPIFSYAQKSNDQKAIDSSSVLKPKVIPVISIIQNIEKANEEIKSTERKAKSSNSIIKIDSLFPGYVIFIERQKKKVKNFKKSNPNRQKINNLIRKWKGYQIYLNNWQSIVNNFEAKNTKLIEVISLKENT